MRSKLCFKKSFPLFRLLAVLMALLVLTGCSGASPSSPSDQETQNAAPAEDVIEEAPAPVSLTDMTLHTISDALLYQLSDGVLEYNVLSAIPAEDVLVLDHTGSGISSLDELSALLAGMTQAVTADLTLNEEDELVALCITDCSPRPTVGISWKSEDQDYSNMRNIIFRNGGIPLELPQIMDIEGAKEAVSLVDGVILTGGYDIDPSYYGQENTASQDINLPRDVSDLALAEAAIDEDIPLLAICRGFQVMNVALGGELIQDIPTYIAEHEIETDILHMDGMRYHDVAIDPGSLWLYNIVGSETYHNAGTSHHQALDPDHLADGLTVVARTSDGIIEAAEYQANLFALGIQFHPEWDAITFSSDERDLDQMLCNRFFRTLIQYAGVHLQAEPAGADTPQ